jgi:hypothetical protein
MLNLTDRCRVALGLAMERKVTDTFSVASTDRMPSDASGEANLDAADHGMRCRIVPSIKHAGVRHRITVRCYQCGAWVPSGRYAQHVGRGTCKATFAHCAKVRSLVGTPYRAGCDCSHCALVRDERKRAARSAMVPYWGGTTITKGV